MSYQNLLTRYQIISEQVTIERLSVILRELEEVVRADTPGDIAEFGCYIGTTSLFIRRVLDEYKASATRLFYAYDSFEGLPAKEAQDQSVVGDQFQAGKLTVSKKQFLQEFRKAGLTPPVTHKAWFSNLSDNQLPQQIAFAYLDGDFYDSILSSLQLVWPRLAPTGVITIDDYGREALPGVERAVRQFTSNKQVSIHHEHHIAILRRRA